MNTDNMSILGLTIDFGPYAFLDDYQPDFICNHSDYQGRYAFDNQPAVAYWNLHRLGQALSGLISADQIRGALDAYEPALMVAFGEQMRQKLGFFSRQNQDNDLLTELLSLMAKEGRDYTRTFRALSDVVLSDSTMALRDDFIDRAAFDGWHQKWRLRLQQDGVDDVTRQTQMKAVNPKRILRNYLAQNAIEAAEKDDVSVLTRLHQGLQNPYEDDAAFDDLSALPPDWGKTLEISCSS